MGERIVPVLPGADAGNWYVLHTKPRQEKQLCMDLRAMRIAAFLPLHSRTRIRGRRRYLIEEPLFPGYLFLRGDTDQVYRADRTKRVVRPIAVADQRTLDWELRNLHRALLNEAPLDPYPYLRAGVRVEVRSGPFAGLQGVIENRTSAERLVLQVDMLGRGVSIELDGAAVEPLD